MWHVAKTGRPGLTWATTAARGGGKPVLLREAAYSWMGRTFDVNGKLLYVTGVSTLASRRVAWGTHRRNRTMTFTSRARELANFAE